MASPRTVALLALLLLTPVRARADEAGVHACDSLAIDVAADLDQAWSIAAAALPEELARALSPEECAHATVSLTRAPQSGSADATIRTADGRVATRRIREPRGLFPVILGLLATAPVEPAPPPAPSAPVLDRHELPDFGSPPAAPSRPDEAKDVGVVVGFGLGGRGGLPSKVLMADIELFAEVLLRSWIILASVRYAPIATLPGVTLDGDQYEEAGLGLGLGRRLVWGRSSLDVAFVPTLAIVTMETDVPIESSGTVPDLRLDVCARYGYATGHGWRFNVALDTDVAPNGLIRAQHPSPMLPAVPAWTLGLRLGMSASLL
jgi:hypothetical protein